MKKSLILAAIVALFAAPAAAQTPAPDTIYPEQIAGVFGFSAQAPPPELDAAGLPLTPLAQSISLHYVEAPDVQIPDSCTITDAEGFVDFILTITDNGERRVMRGRAHVNDDCTGLRSGPSFNAAVVFFNDMGEPVLKVARPPE